MKTEHIPNLNLVQTYDKFYKDAQIHYESLHNLASFFGRAMHLHRHDRYYQLHYIHHGKVHLILGEHEFNEEAPLLFFTPPPEPHGFVTDPNATGQVLTIHQSLVLQLLETLNQNDHDFAHQSACITLANLPSNGQQHHHALDTAFQGLQQEAEQQNPSRDAALYNWSQLVLINLFRLIASTQQVSPSQHSQSFVFRKYLSLIEAYYTQNLPIPAYAKLLNITEGRLNKICRDIAGISSKQLIYERLVQEAKYLLSYTSLSIKETAFSLGFQDPAYFTRFFIKYTSQTPKDYRQSRLMSNPKQTHENVSIALPENKSLQHQP